MKLRTRFALLLGTIAGITFLLFFVYARYAVGQMEQEFTERSQMLTDMLATKSEFALLMLDEEGLKETLTSAHEQDHILAGAFFDAEGNLVSEVNQDLLPPALRTPGEQALRTGETLDGVPVLIVRDTVGSASEPAGTVQLAVSAEGVQAKREASLLLSLLAPLFIILLTGGILVLLGRTVIKPLKHLQQTAQAFEQGNLSVRAALDQRDEIGELAASLNAMMEASEQNILAIQEHTEEAGKARERAEALRREAEAERAYLQEQFDRIAEVIHAVRAGDLTRRLTVDRDDAVGSLMTQINLMTEDLEGLIREVLVASGELAQVAAHVAASAEHMSEGVQKQSSQTMEVASAIEQMAATVADASAHASSANTTAEQAAALASSGEAVFVDNIASMHRIADIVRNATQQITSLGESSSQIGEIIQVISEIADQTNLLALNAAIEAARAGDQGRGFAVVADEVRKLAERTTSATKEIADMITVIQAQTREVVTSMTKGNDEVESGLALSDQASGSLRQIIEAINDMAQMISQIATSSEEQAATSAEISRHVDGILSVAMEVSETTRGLTQTADDVNRQVDTLRQRVARFQTRQQAAATRRQHAQAAAVTA